MNRLILEDYYDLLNLHKALMEAKFHDNPENSDVAGSPVIAQIMNNIVDILSKIDPHADTNAWKQWRELSRRKKNRDKIWINIIKHASQNNMWSAYTKEKKLEMAKNYISPFCATEEDLEDFIAEVDQILEA